MSMNADWYQTLFLPDGVAPPTSDLPEEFAVVEGDPRMAEAMAGEVVAIGMQAAEIQGAHAVAGKDLRIPRFADLLGDHPPDFLIRQNAVAAIEASIAVAKGIGTEENRLLFAVGARNLNPQNLQRLPA